MKKKIKDMDYLPTVQFMFFQKSFKKFNIPQYNNLFLDICSQFRKSIYVYKYNGTFIDIEG